MRRTARKRFAARIAHRVGSYGLAGSSKPSAKIASAGTKSTAMPREAQLIRTSREVNDGKASTDEYFLMKNLCAKIDSLVAAKAA